MARVALIQLSVDSTEPVPERVERALDMVDAAAEDAQTVVLPELWPTGGFDIQAGVDHAEPLDGALVVRLAEAARDNAIWLHGGSFVEVDGAGRYFNTSVLFDPDGALVASYRKIHVFSYGSRESELLSPGADVVVVPTALGPTALATCYDLRFPELFRAFVDAGAQAVIVTSAWPSVRISRWSVLAAARAIENQMYVIGCNEVGVQHETELGGHSIVCNPWGDVLAEADDAEEVIYVTLDPGEPARVREEFPALRDRRL